MRSRATARCSSTGVSEAASKGTTSSGSGTVPWGGHCVTLRPTDTPHSRARPYLQAVLELLGHRCPQLLQLGCARRLRRCRGTGLLLPPHTFALHDEGGEEGQEGPQGPTQSLGDPSPPAPRGRSGRGRSAPAFAGRDAPSPPGPAGRHEAASSHRTSERARGAAPGTPSDRRCGLGGGRGTGAAWTDRRMGEWLDRGTDRWMARDWRTDKDADRKTRGKRAMQTDRGTDRRTEPRMDERTDGQRDGLTLDDLTAVPHRRLCAAVHLLHRAQQLLVRLQGQVHPAGGTGCSGSAGGAWGQRGGCDPHLRAQVAASFLSIRAIS